MNLTVEHLELLRALDELEEPGQHPSTKAVGERLHALWKERGGPYFWQAYAPWHGTSPYAEELRDAGLLEVHVGIAKFHKWDEPLQPVQEFWLGLTPSGRRALADAAGDV